MSRRPKAVQSVEVVLVDAFTSTPFAGNPAAVVPDRATRVRVGGHAAIVLTGRLSLP